MLRARLEPQGLLVQQVQRVLQVLLVQQVQRVQLVLQVQPLQARQE